MVVKQCAKTGIKYPGEPLEGTWGNMVGTVICRIFKKTSKNPLVNLVKENVLTSFARQDSASCGLVSMLLMMFILEPILW